MDGSTGSNSDDRQELALRCSPNRFLVLLIASIVLLPLLYMGIG